jgi:hypothetical protein
MDPHQGFAGAGRLRGVDGGGNEAAGFFEEDGFHGGDSEVAIEE